MTMIKKKIMCLVLSLAFVVMSSQAQAGGSPTQVLAKTDSTVSTDSPLWKKFWDFRLWRLQPRKIVSAKASESFDRAIFFKKAQLLSKEDWTPYVILGTTDHVKKIIEGENSVVTNAFGMVRQFAIATELEWVEGRYIMELKAP
jgi:hypothetical protein